MEIHTARLVLRPIRPDDREGMGALLRLPEVHPWVRDEGPPDEATLDALVAAKVADWEAGRSACLSVFEDGAYLGFVHLHQLEQTPAFLSYALTPACWGRGLGQEAVAAVLARLPAFGVGVLEAQTHLDNPRSAALLEAVGFVEMEPTAGRRVYRFEPTRPPDLYERQHEVWSAWSETEGNAAEVARVLTAWVGPGRVLDLGCGVGRELCALVAEGWTGEGMDAGPALVERARSRAERLGVDAVFRVGDILREPVPEAAFDRVLCWDSTLALWLPPIQGRVLRRWVAALKPGGVFVLGQLGQERYAAEGAVAVVLNGQGVGPGTTRRRYAWDPVEQVLVDSVVWESPDGERERLEDQRLHLQGGAALAAMLEQAGLEQVRVVGAEGWTWTESGGPVDQAWQVAAIGRRPATG